MVYLSLSEEQFIHVVFSLEVEVPISEEQCMHVGLFLVCWRHHYLRSSEYKLFCVSLMEVPLFEEQCMHIVLCLVWWRYHYLRSIVYTLVCV